MKKTSFVSNQYLSRYQRTCELFGSAEPSKVLRFSYGDDSTNIDEEEDDCDNDFYSPTSWDREPGESDEDYNDRMEDQDSLLDYFS